MSKVVTMLVTLGVVLLGLNLLGIIQDTGTSTLLNIFKNPTQLFNLSFYLSITNLTTLLLGTGIAIGLFFSQKFDLAIFVGFTSTLLLIGWDILGLFNVINSYNSDLALLLISPFLIMYLITAIEWWRGIG